MHPLTRPSPTLWTLASVALLTLGCGSSTTDPGMVGPGSDAGAPDPDAGARDASGPLPRCGDGVVGPSEACDDGNAVGGDGCDAACASIEPNYDCSVPGAACETLPYDELRELGFDRYLGTVTPSVQTVDGDLTQYEWDVEDGPICMDGTPFRMMTRDMGSEDLLIFLEGGGLCYSELCIAQRTANEGMSTSGILDPTHPDNPVADWNVAFLRYCDGSLFAGDTDTQRGLWNLSAALDAIRAQFPTPRRIIVSGVSAGGYGTIPAAALTRIAYPGPEILVLNDSGIGLGRPDDPDFLEGIMEEFDTDQYLEAACEAVDCEPSPHVTWLVDYAFSEDPDVRVAGISSYRDLVIGQVFLRVLPSEFEAALRFEAGAAAERHPSRFQYFAFEGTSHTVLSADTPIDLPRPFNVTDWAVADFYRLTAGGVLLTDWIDAALNDPVRWRTTTD